MQEGAVAAAVEAGREQPLASKDIEDALELLLVESNSAHKTAEALAAAV